MILYVLFGQRQETYPGQHAPEALDILDEYGYEENGAWLHMQMESFRVSGDFIGLRIFEIDLGGEAQDIIRRQLVGFPVIQGRVRK